jgi:hypothetical protein
VEGIFERQALGLMEGPQEGRTVEGDALRLNKDRGGSSRVRWGRWEMTGVAEGSRTVEGIFGMVLCFLGQGGEWGVKSDESGEEEEEGQDHLKSKHRTQPEQWKAVDRKWKRTQRRKFGGGDGR